MMFISTLEIRKIFFNFFKKRDYAIKDSSSLIPNNDNSILFTNAGMNQFKDFFSGKKTSSIDKISTIQRCLRAGGKHNDLEEVGYTNRHHTFFEMLGNFSFGKVTKEEIITDIWIILTNKDQFNISPDRFLITVNRDDIETYNIWNRLIGLNRDRIISLSGKETQDQEYNFWHMSDIGPCGPSTEVFYELKENNSEGYKNPSIKNFLNNSKDYLEIWNIVFMQYYKNKDYKNKFSLKKLENLGIDTGIGLERLASILQGVNSNYKIDIFKNLISIISKYLNLTDLEGPSLNVLSDHIRAIIFLIYDGILPSNEGRGYVLRRIIRRAIRHGRYLGVKNHFLYKLIKPCFEEIKLNYPSLNFKIKFIEEVVEEEEKRFSITLDRAINKLFKIINNLPNNILDIKIANHLYETFGLPVDLTREICKERNIIINLKN